jgi:glycosyltransferase involved in cell wall biosynthesis
MSGTGKKNIVVSAVNLTGAGPGVILDECLNYLSRGLSGAFNVIALVHDKSLCYHENIKFYEFPKSKKSWLNRMYYEYVYFKKLSLKLEPYLWLSLHDMTPNVRTEVLAVYCHNASAFYRISPGVIKMDPRFALFNIFYKYIYAVNIRKNDFVIVQQDWLRREFRKLYNIDNIIVSHPGLDDEPAMRRSSTQGPRRPFLFFYPALPRVFKNFESVCEAVKMLKREGTADFEVYFTINGTENRYARSIYERYGAMDNVKFIGPQPRSKIYEYYNEAGCLLFPSKLESWGLPISEFKSCGKPILAADLEYARESVGDYKKARFFDPGNYAQLAGLMRDAVKDRLAFENTKSAEIEPPFAADWKELFDILLKRDVKMDV